MWPHFILLDLRTRTNEARRGRRFEPNRARGGGARSRGPGLRGHAPRRPPGPRGAGRGGGPQAPDAPRRPPPCSATSLCGTETLEATPSPRGGPPCVRGTRCLARPAGASVAAAPGASLPPAPPEAETPQPSGVRSLESHCSQVPRCDVPTSLCLSFPVCATGQRQKLLGSRIPPGLTGVCERGETRKDTAPGASASSLPAHVSPAPRGGRRLSTKRT